MSEYGSLPTEQPHDARPELDRLDSDAIARLLLSEEARAVAAVETALPAIATAAEWATQALRAGGRLIYVGAGTSGRLGVLDAAEMGPTFGAREGVVIALIAGGTNALTQAIEGAEDDATAGADALRALDPREEDLVVGISMSGTARYVGGALGAAPGRTVMLTANPNALFPADLHIALALGPEVLAGSTRLKGGSATKKVLNIISTAAMAGSGAVYGPWMVRVRPTNRKLRDRAERMVERLADLPRDRAAALLREAGDDVRVAILMARRDLDAAAARARLDACHGRLREALA
ncbi:MAG: N-acetylmuramic acid 6-phosphate etherase [Planctomycetota bacterium]